MFDYIQESKSKLQYWDEKFQNALPNIGHFQINLSGSTTYSTHPLHGIDLLSGHATY